MLFTANQGTERVNASTTITSETRSTAIASTSKEEIITTTNAPLPLVNTGIPTGSSIHQNKQPSATRESFTNDNNEDIINLMLEPELRPHPPDPNCQLSKETFEEHKKLANEYLKVVKFLKIF